MEDGQFRDFDASVVRPIGELDLDGASAFGQSLVRACKQANDVVVDLSEVTFLDSTGIGVLAGALRVLRARGGSLTVEHAAPRVRWALHLVGLNQLLHLDDAPLARERPADV